MGMLSVGTADPPSRIVRQQGYTRLTLTLLCYGKGPERIYDEVRRNALRRLFAGKSISRVLTIHSSLTRPHVTTTVAAITADYESSKGAGESWTSEFNGTLALTPYFRVDPDNIVSLKAELRASSSYRTNIAQGSLDLIQRAADLVAPGASLLNTLNEDRYNEASRFVDQSISSLLRESIIERASNDFPMAAWAGQPLAYLTVNLPLGNEITPGKRNSAVQQAKVLGVWKISSEPTILSIFTDVSASSDTSESATALQARFKELTQHTILNFRVSGDLTLTSALAAESGIAAARDRLVSTKNGNKVEDPSGLRNDARNLCMLVADKAEKLGFNRIDVAAAVWAYSRQNFSAEEVALAMRDDRNCPPLTEAHAYGLPKEGGY